MEKYCCTVCAYVYDPALGDPEDVHGPDTPFDALPDDWVCPVAARANGPSNRWPNSVKPNLL